MTTNEKRDDDDACALDLMAKMAHHAAWNSAVVDMLLRRSGTTCCDDCGANVSGPNAAHHKAWHDHLARMFDIAAGGRTPSRGGVVGAFKRAVGIGRWW